MNKRSDFAKDLSNPTALCIMRPLFLAEFPYLGTFTKKDYYAIIY